MARQTPQTTGPPGPDEAGAEARLRHLSAAWGLSPRQTDVLGVVVEGRTNKEIAAVLGLSPYTVAQHVAEILRRAGCENRTEVAWHFWRR